MCTQTSQRIWAPELYVCCSIQWVEWMADRFHTSTRSVCFAWMITVVHWLVWLLRLLIWCYWSTLTGSFNPTDGTLTLSHQFPDNHICTFRRKHDIRPSNSHLQSTVTFNTFHYSYVISPICVERDVFADSPSLNGVISGQLFTPVDWITWVLSAPNKFNRAISWQKFTYIQQSFRTPSYHTS
jgi:hypothetical protein